MASSTLAERDQIKHPQPLENSLEPLIAKLYGLKEKFEALYYGKAECKKYDKARNFTIQLNATLYRANQIQSASALFQFSNKKKAEIYKRKHVEASATDSRQIKMKIKKLNKELDDLLN